MSELEDSAVNASPGAICCTFERAAGSLADPAESSQWRHAVVMMILEFLASIVGHSPSTRRKIFDLFREEISKEANFGLLETDEFTTCTQLAPLYYFMRHHVFPSLSRNWDPSRDTVVSACCEAKSVMPFTLNRQPSLTRMPMPSILPFLSRFSSEFVQMSVLGKGGFGKVYKVRNKLDNCEYAVKKIKLKHITDETFAKVIREVKVFASLDHSNIVRYHFAWIEQVACHFRQNISKQKSITAGDVSFSESVVFTDDGSFDESRLEINDENEDEDPSFSDVQFPSMADNFSSQSGFSERSSFRSANSRDDLSSIGSQMGPPCSWHNPLQIKPRLVLYIQMQLCDLSLRQWLANRNKHIHPALRCAQTRVIQFSGRQ
eukprot:m.210946 g.210946  ORF g.210946 m.210946 type:complete len:376 (+) comp39749_c0_seq42:92-1219(+)